MSGLFGLPSFMQAGYFDPSQSGSAPQNADRFMLISYKGSRPVRYQCVHPCATGYQVEELNPNRYFLDVNAVLDAVLDLDQNILEAGGTLSVSLTALAIGSMFSVAWITIAALVMTVVSSIWFRDACSEVMEQHIIYQVESQNIIVETEEEREERVAQLSVQVGVVPTESLFHKAPTEEQIAAKTFIITTIAEGVWKAGRNQSELKKQGTLLDGYVHPLRQLVIVFSDETLKQAMIKLLSFDGWAEKKVKEGYLNGTKEQPGMGLALAAAKERGDLELHLEPFCTEIASVAKVELAHLQTYVKQEHWENFLRACAGLKPIE